MNQKIESPVAAGIALEKYGLTAGTPLLDMDPGEPLSMMERLLGEDMRREGFKLATSVEMFLTGDLNIPEVCQRVWSKWYGSRRAADKVEAVIRSSQGAQQAKFLKKLRHLPPLMLLTVVFGSRGAWSLIKHGLSSESINAIRPDARLPFITEELFAKYPRKQPQGRSYQAHESGELATVARTVEQAWPFMAKLHDHGFYRHATAERLVSVDEICSVIEAGGVSAADLTLFRVSIGLLLSNLLPRIEALAAITRPAVAQSYCTGFEFGGIKHATFDPNVCFWDQVDGDHFEETCKQIALESRMRLEFQGDESRFSAQFDDVSANIVRASSLGRVVEAVFSELCCEPIGYEFYDLVRDTLVDCYEALDDAPELDLTPFPDDLLGRPLNLLDIQAPDLALLEVGRLRNNIHSEVMRLTGIIAGDKDRAERLEAIQTKIRELAVEASLANMKKMGELAGEASKLIESGRGWLLEVFSPAAHEYVAHWHNFYAAIDALPRKGLPAMQHTPPDSADSTPGPGPGDAENAELKELLHLAQADNEHLRRDLDELRASAHRMRSQLANKQETEEENIPLDCMGAIARLVARKDCGPADVLSYYAGTAPDRLTVLPGALAGAQAYQIPYEPTERMIEVMGKLVGPYLDALRSGQPDTLARNVLGGKTYAAKESETTLATPRFRAMREFEYKGEKRLFVQHLRISNEVGAKGMRIYFGVDGDGQDKRIIVAYVGPHMGVPSSN